MIFLVLVSVAIGLNLSVKSTPITCIKPLLTILDFRRYLPFGPNLVLKTHFTGIGFLPFARTRLSFLGIHASRYRIFLTSAIILNFHRRPRFILSAPLNVKGSPTSEVTAVLCISSYICSAISVSSIWIGITLVWPVTIAFPSRISGLTTFSPLEFPYDCTTC